MPCGPPTVDHPLQGGRAAWSGRDHRGAHRHASTIVVLDTWSEHQKGPPGPTPPLVPASLSPISNALVEQIHQLDVLIATLLDAHPDAHILRSLPRCGTIRAATMLTEIGDCRARFPEATSLACWAVMAHQPEHPAGTVQSRSATHPTAGCATYCAGSLATHASPTNGLPTVTNNSGPTGNDTPTPSASSPAHGPGSSGAAGKTTSPTTPTNTALSKPCETGPLDIGLLRSEAPPKSGRRPSPSMTRAELSSVFDPAARSASIHRTTR